MEAGLRGRPGASLPASERQDGGGQERARASVGPRGGSGPARLARAGAGPSPGGARVPSRERGSWHPDLCAVAPAPGSAGARGGWGRGGAGSVPRMTPGLGPEFYGRVKEGVVAAAAGYGADQAHEVTIESARLEGEGGDISLVLTFRWDRHP